MLRVDQAVLDWPAYVQVSIVEAIPLLQGVAKTVKFASVFRDHIWPVSAGSEGTQSVLLYCGSFRPWCRILGEPHVPSQSRAPTMLI